MSIEHASGKSQVECSALGSDAAATIAMSDRCHHQCAGVQHNGGTTSDCKSPEGCCCKQQELIIDISKHSNAHKNMSCSSRNGGEDHNDHSSSSSTSFPSSKSSTGGESCVKTKTKTLKSLLKKVVDPKQDFIKSHNKRVKFSETMQVFCYELPDNQMPQIIALKPEMSLMEFQSYMFEPPAEYQDFLAFEPPPDYRDFIANSLNVFRNEVTFDYIEDDGDDDSENSKNDGHSVLDSKAVGHMNSLMIAQDQCQNSKWQSMILDNNLDSLEEEQIIGVLKEDDILQAIGSQITLPVASSDSSNGPMNGDRGASDEDGEARAFAFEVVDGHGQCDNLSSKDFPVHHLNSYILNAAGQVDDDDEEACCIDSSPNGSLQDLASDSSITSQDTIILINQNKTFHLDSVHHSTINSTDPSANIYENLQPCNSEITIISAVTQPMNGEVKSDSGVSSQSSLTPTTTSAESNSSTEVFYENTSQLLATANSASSLVANHVKNFEKRLSTSSSEESKTDESETKNSNNESSNKFKQNIMFYESIVQQQNSNHGSRPSGQTVAQSAGKLVGSSDVSHHLLVSSAPGGAMHLPYYAIVDTSRASPSSSLSSTSSSSSSLMSGSASAPNTSQSALSSSLGPSVSSSAGAPMQQQLSPNSNSSASSSNSSNLMGSDYILQYAPGHGLISAKRVSTLPDSMQPMDSNGPSNYSGEGKANIMPPASHANVSTAPSSGPRMNTTHMASQQVCFVNNVPANSNGIRPGQIVYRYPYAFIQPGANGISTIRPVQYIVQTHAQPGAPSVIYNPQLVVQNQPGSFTISSSANSSASDSASSSTTSSQSSGNAPAIQPKPIAVQHAQIVVPNAGDLHQQGHPTAVPIRRIIVPQGTVLAPRIMHLHQQHKQNPPPYQYYVQQRQQQTVLAYQPTSGGPGTVQRQTSPVFFQSGEPHPHGHTDFPNPSEIRRRDGLYAYPQVLLKRDDVGNSSHNSNNHEATSEERDELEEFVQQEQQRTERIKKRYSFTEDDDPTFGFARRPSVRGIRPKFGSTNEIIQQMTSTIPKSVSQPKMIMTGGTFTAAHSQPTFAYGTLPKNAQLIQVNSTGTAPSQAKMVSIVRQMGDIQLKDNAAVAAIPIHFQAQTLPRQLHKMGQAGSEPTHEIVRIFDASMLNGPINAGATLPRGQLKLQLQKQTPTQHQVKLIPTQRANLGQSGNEQVPQGSGFSPNHPMPGSETTFSSAAGPNKDIKPNLVSESIKSNANPDNVYYSMNV